MPLTLEIVTPEGQLYSDTIETVVIPTAAGEIGILPGHIPLLTVVESGELRVTKDGRTQHLLVGDGFAQIAANKVSVIAERALRWEQIDEQAAEHAMARAQEELKRRDSLEPAEVERLEGVVRFAVAQLGIKRRK